MPYDGFDLTFPVYPRTGKERSAEDLAEPDERSLAYRLAPENIQAGYLRFEAALGPNVPKQVCERIAVARDLAAYAYFCYEFNAVSLFWSVSCIEMALRTKFKELNPGPFSMQRKGEVVTAALNQLEGFLRKGWRIVGMKEFNFSFRALLRWAFRARLLPRDIPIPLQEIVHAFNNRFALRVFPERAEEEGLLGPKPTWGDIQRCWHGLSEEDRKKYQSDSADVLVEELPKLRNWMAHPSDWNWVSIFRSPLAAFELLVDIINRLWPGTDPEATPT
jgi:hypothetical protein